MRSRPVVEATAQSAESPRSRSVDQRLNERLGPLGITFTQSPSLVLGTSGLVVAVTAIRFAGVWGAGLVLAVSGLGWVSLDWITALLIRRRSDRLLPEVALRLARSLRSGLPPEGAIVEVAGELDGDHPALARVAGQLHTGRPIVDTVESWLRSTHGDAEQLMAAGLLLGIRHGGDLATAIDAVGEGLRDDLDLDARRRVLLTQSRMSAAVLVALPVAFAVVASGLHGGSIYQGAVGKGLLLGGVALDLLGIQWMRSLMRRIQ